MPTVSERRRLDLYERLGETLGREHAEVLMEYLPPVGWNDVARRHDLDLLRADIQILASELRAEMHQGFSRLLMWLVGTIVACVGVTLALIAYVN